MRSVVPGGLRHWLVLVVLLAPPFGRAEAAPRSDGEKQVLVLYATRRDSQIAVLGDQKLPTVLERGIGQRLDFYSEYLDLARFPEKGYEATVRDFLRSKYASQRFDLVIAMHQITFDFAAEQRDLLFPGVPIVFYSEGAAPQRVANTTGVLSPRDFASTVSFAATLQPDLRHIFVVGGSDRRDKEFENVARTQFRPFASRFAFTYLSGLPTEQLKTRLSSLPPQSMVFYLVVNRDGSGVPRHPIAYLEDLAPVVNAPIYGWVDSMIGHGIVGGSLKNQAKQLEAVGELAVRVLREGGADGIPVATPDLIVPQVDWRELRRWGIATTRLPAGTQVLFEDPTLWSRYKVYIIGGLVLVCAQTVLIGVLLAETSRRRQAQAHLRGSQDALRTSYERIRTLGARLLNAQDTERARIARELHDDVSQQLALLSVDLELLRREADPNGRSLNQVVDRTQAISRSLHDLAHSLYPAKLRLMGLVAALQGLQREAGRSGLHITFTHHNMPPSLPPDLTLCLFRVAQEALQNAIKYSEAHGVAMRLDASPEGIRLSIADDGLGFDVEGAIGRGLGLISMRERIEAIGGHLDIRSGPGAGTRVEILVPHASEWPAAAAV